MTYIGEYNRFQVVAGETYEWSLCANDGVEVPEGGPDVNLTLRTESGTILCFSDNVYNCGPYPRLRWTANYTGEVRVMINTTPCLTGTQPIGYTMAWRCASCNAYDPCLLTRTLETCGTIERVTLHKSSGAYHQTSSPCDPLYPLLGTEVIFIYTPVLSGLYSITYLSPSSNTTPNWFLKPYSAGCDETGWTCVDETSVGETTSAFQLTAGISYYIMLDQNTSLFDHWIDFRLNCVSAGDACSENTSIDCGSLNTATFNPGQGQWNPPSSPCTSNTPGGERLFTFTPTQTGNYMIEQLSSFDPIDWFYKAPSSLCSRYGWLCIGTLTDGQTSNAFLMLAGTTYHILADASTMDGGNMQFRLLCPGSNPCASVANVGCGVPFSSSITAGSGIYDPPQGSCGYGTPGMERIVRFTAPYSGTYNIRQLSAYAWTDYFFKLEPNGCSGTGWNCIDDLFGAELSGAFTMLQGVTYLIMADPESSTGGIVSFQIECSSPYDACALIEPLAGCNEPMSVQFGSGNGSFLNPGTSCGANTPGRERIFTYTATQGGQRFFQQFNSIGTINYYVKPQSGGCNGTGWTCLGGISGAGVTSTYTMTAGTTYLVMLDALSTAGGSVDFVLGCAASGSVCTTSLVGSIVCGADVAVNVPSGAGGYLLQPGCSGDPMPGRERIYAFTPTASGVHTVLQIMEDIDSYTTYRHSYRAADLGSCSVGWTCIGSRQGTDLVGTMNLTAGITYWLMLDASSMTGGQVTIRIECPNYDACNSITPVYCGVPEYAVLGAGQGIKTLNNCEPFDPVQDLFGKERIFRFRPSYAGYHTLTQTGTGGTLHYSVIDEPSLENSETTCTEQNGFVCWDVITGPYEETQPIWLDANIDYLIMVDQFSTDFTAVTFTIHCPAPPNDDCADATALSVFHYDTNYPLVATLGSTAGAATQDGPMPSCDTYPMENDGPWPDVWFTFQTGLDPVVAEVYLGSVSGLSLELYLDNGTGCVGVPVWCQSEVDGTLLLPVQPFSIYRLRAFSNVSYSVPGSFSICLHRPQPPPCASTISPAPFETIEEGSSVHFEWTSSPGATNYLIDLLDITAYAPDTVDGFPITTFDTDLVLNALPTGDYTWRVTPLSVHGTFGYCPYTYFSIIPPTTTSLQVPVRAVLDGAWVPADGLMRDNLRTATLIPAQHPYGGAPWFHDGSEELESFALQTTGPNAVVDWVLVELRAQGSPQQVVARRAGLLQRDGDIVETDGSSPLTFLAVPIGNYHVAVLHRNHLGAMTLDAIYIDGLQATIDLSSAALPTYGLQGRKQLSGGNSPLGLWAGDISADGQIKYVGENNDRDRILVAIGGIVPTNTIQGYRTEDITLDGQVKYVGEGNDRDLVLLNIGGTIPTATVQAQLP